MKFHDLPFEWMAALFVMVVWFSYMVRQAILVNRCRWAFNNATRFCQCGGTREFDGREGRTCTDHCTACGKEYATPDHVFLIGHQCSEATMDASGLCRTCGRKHRLPQGSARAVTSVASA